MAALALAYAFHEADRTPYWLAHFNSSLVCQERMSPWAAALAVRTLRRRGMIALEGAGSRRQVVITALGIQWFEEHVDYRREANIYHYRIVRGGMEFVGPAGSGFWGDIYKLYWRLRYSRLVTR